MAVFTYTVDLPKGSRLMPNAVASQILDDWQIQGVSTFATGQVSNVTLYDNRQLRFLGRRRNLRHGIVQTGSAVLPRDQRNGG